MSGFGPETAESGMSALFRRYRREGGRDTDIANPAFLTHFERRFGLGRQRRRLMLLKSMASPPDHKEPVVEPPPSDDHPDDLTSRALRLRIRQQELLAELGVLALQGTTFMDMLQQRPRITAEGLDAEYCKVLEYIPAENRLLVRAGVGWDAGVVGSASVGADFGLPGGYALRTGKPVISNHLENEQRFRTPELLVEHGIRGP